MDPLTDYDNVRIRRDFIPDRYNLHFYFDIDNISYKLDSELILKVNIDSPKMVILNALKKNYKIEKIIISRHDKISDHFVEEKEVEFFYSDEIRRLFCHDSFTDLYFLYNDDELFNLDDQEKVKIIRNELKQSDPSLYSKIETFIENDQDFLNILLTRSHNILEEGLYIPLNFDFELSKNSIIKLKINLAGNILLSTEHAAGLYFSLFGPSKELMFNVSEFKELWKQKNFQENNLNNAVICAVNEPVDARAYMPCFDEPSYKSHFNVKITVDSKYPQSSPYFRVISNGDLVEILENKDLNQFTYIFSESPLMSVYLLTFVLGRYEYMETMIDKTRMRIYTPLNSITDGRFGLEIGQKSLEFYQKYFRIPFAFPKIDLVPVPDMDYRAMENWGCIVYLNYALMSPCLQEIKERKNIARTTSHELAHMWFGNLVTMDWWDDIWLNEGFARFMEFECLETIKPEFEIWSKYIELIYNTALDIDERSNTHPVRCVVPSPRKLADIFDTISYAKGASVLRMLSCWTGKENFREAIIAYLNKYQYSNTKTENLWDSFKEAVNYDVAPVMDSWLKLAGHPIVFVSLNQSSEEWSIKLHQKPFPANFNLIIDNSDTLWKIPIFIKTKGGTFNFLMQEKEMDIKLKDVLVDQLQLFQNTDFVKVNENIKGFYRVRYTDNLLNNLLENNKKLSNLDISGLLFDYYSYSDYLSCFKIIEKIKPIDDYLVLSQAMKIYNLIKQRLFQHTCFDSILCNHQEYETKFKYLVMLQEKFKKYFSNIIEIDKKILLEKIYVNDSSHYLDEKKDEFYDLALYFYAFICKDEEVIRYVVENFEKNHERLHKNFKISVYAIITSFSFYILKDTQKELKLYEIPLKEFCDNYYDLSLQARKSYKEALINFEYSSDSLVEYFMKRLEERSFFNYFKYNFFYSFPNNRFKILKTAIQIFKSKNNDNIEKQSNEHHTNKTDIDNLISWIKSIIYDLYDQDLRLQCKIFIKESLCNYDNESGQISKLIEEKFEKFRNDGKFFDAYKITKDIVVAYLE